MSKMQTRISKLNQYNVYERKEVNLLLVHGGPETRGNLKDLAVMMSDISKHFYRIFFDM